MCQYIQPLNPILSTMELVADRGGYCFEPYKLAKDVVYFSVTYKALSRINKTESKNRTEIHIDGHFIYGATVAKQSKAT